MTADPPACWVCGERYDQGCECPPCHRPPWVVICAWQVGAVIGRRVVINHDPRRPIPEVPDRLVYATIVEHPEAVTPGYDPTFIEVGTRDGRHLLNPISNVLVEATPQEYTQVRYYQCGPILSHANWEPPRVPLPHSWPPTAEKYQPINAHSGDFPTTMTEVGEQFTLPIYP